MELLTSRLNLNDFIDKPKKSDAYSISKEAKLRYK